MEINEQWLTDQRRPGNTFCPMLFVHKHVDTMGRRQLCCAAQRREAGWSDAEVLKAGAQSLAGHAIPECSQCYVAEADSRVSFRQSAIFTAATMIEDLDHAITQNTLVDLWYDLRVSNLCNLGCITCGPQSSSTLAKKFNVAVPFIKWAARNINPNAKKIYLAGGEPFLIKEFQSVLQQITNSDCEVVVNTNGTVIDTFLLAELARFSNLCITLSVDGLGELASKIRVGTDWAVVEQNVERLKAALPQASFLVNTVIQRDNVNELYSIGKWVEQNKFAWTLTLLTNPAALQVDTLEQWHIPAEIFKLAPVRTKLLPMNVLKKLYNAPQNQRD